MVSAHGEAEAHIERRAGFNVVAGDDGNDAVAGLLWGMAKPGKKWQFPTSYPQALADRMWFPRSHLELERRFPLDRL
jgi:hypothetical protein